MLFRRTIRSVLLALALTAGTAELCASAQPANPVSPDLHIVPKSKSLEQKKSGGFTSVLKASALTMGKSLVRQVTYAFGQKQHKQSRLARSLPVTAQQKLLSRADFRAPGALLPAEISIITPMSDKLHGAYQGFLQAISSVTCKTLSSGPVPGIHKGGNEKIFCAAHNFYSANCASVVLCLDHSQGAPSNANRPARAGMTMPSAVAGTLCLNRQDYASARGLATVRGSSALQNHAFARIETVAVSRHARPAKCFPIDPVKGAELLAHGAMGARNALRGDRSRDNRAQSV